ncbi:MAG: fused MFS/spermidine synthase [Planctomycetota bacterium]
MSTGGARPLAMLAPNATVFVSGFCVMVIELVAGRLVSRHLGSSIYTWTSVIGVVLAGLALGNYTGGLLADRFRAGRTLSTLFLLSSALCVSITILDTLVGGWSVLYGLPWPLRVALHVALVFLLPSFMLGTISPVVAKMALGLGRETGRTLGNVYAWGVVGSIVGTFVTGYFLIAMLGTRAIVWLVAGVLALVGIGYLPSSRRSWSVAGLLVVLALLANAPWEWTQSAGAALALREPLDSDVIYRDESRYSLIEIRRDPADPDVRSMYLDKLLHSQVSLANGSDLKYHYERIFAAVTKRLVKDKEKFATLTIGGGGYVFPRYIEAMFPGSRTEVVEIDPAVTRAAIETFGLPAHSSIKIDHEDGRVFANRLSHLQGEGQAVTPYDIVYVDAFSDYAVPYQVTTREFYEKVASLLTAGGICLINMIDMYETGYLLASLVKTVSTVFPFVAVLTEDRPWEKRSASRNTFVIVCARQEIDLQGIGEEYRSGYTIARLPEAEAERLLAGSNALVLSDDYAPVENLLAPAVRASAADHGADELAREGFLLLSRGKSERAAELCRKAINLQPNHLAARHALAYALAQQGRLDEAIKHWQEVTKSHPGFASAHYNLGLALCRRGQLANGIIHLQQAVHLEPNHYQAHNSLGAALLAQERLAEAIEHFQAALRIKPDFQEARANLSRALAAPPSSGRR